MVKSCAIKGCKNNSGSKSKLINSSYHRFPANIKKCNDWLWKCNMKNIIGHSSKIKRLRICSRHFEDCYYTGVNNRLSSDASPTIFDLEPTNFQSSNSTIKKSPNTFDDEISKTVTKTDIFCKESANISEELIPSSSISNISTEPNFSNSFPLYESGVEHDTLIQESPNTFDDEISKTIKKTDIFCTESANIFEELIPNSSISNIITELNFSNLFQLYELGVEHDTLIQDFDSSSESSSDSTQSEESLLTSTHTTNELKMKIKKLKDQLQEMEKDIVASNILSTGNIKTFSSVL